MSSAARPVSDWPEDPYPGTWPDHSYLVREEVVHRVEASANVPSGWVVRDESGAQCLDEWLAERGAPPLAERTAVLSFGSNRCPAKVVRQGGPAVNLACRASGLAAVWSHGTRASDGQVVATLVAADDEHVTDFFVSMCTEDDLALLDVVEGRGRGYDLVPLDPGQVVLEDGSEPEPVHAYVGLRPHRWPVAGEDGHPIRLDAMSQAEVAAWRDAGPAHWEPDPSGPFRSIGDLP